MTRNAQKIDRIQREVARLLDVGSKTEVTDKAVVKHLRAAKEALEHAWTAAQSADWRRIRNA